MGSALHVTRRGIPFPCFKPSAIVSKPKCVVLPAPRSSCDCLACCCCANRIEHERHRYGWVRDLAATAAIDGALRAILRTELSMMCVVIRERRTERHQVFVGAINADGEGLGLGRPHSLPQPSPLDQSDGAWGITMSISCTKCTVMLKLYIITSTLVRIPRLYAMGKDPCLRMKSLFCMDLRRTFRTTMRS